MLDQLFDFQLEDVEKIQSARGRLIGNDPGTGKTYEAIALDYKLREHFGDDAGYTLVIAPKTVLGVWEQHFRELTDLTPVVVDPKNRGAFLKTPGHVFILNYDVLRLMPELQSIQWMHIIADECHRIKNRKAQMTQAIKKIPGLYKTAMSGTPITNRPPDVWSTLNWLYPHQFRGYWKFYANHVDFEIQYPQGYHKIKGFKNLDELHDQIAPYFVSRRKEDVLKDLPDKYYTDIWVDITPRQRRMYIDMNKELLAWLGEFEDKPLPAPIVVVKMLRLQMMALATCDFDDDGSIIMTEPSSKLDALMELLEDREGEQIVIFSQFKKMIRLVTQRLEKDGISYVTLTGDVTGKDRTRHIETFQRGGARVLAGTIKAGGIGITLHSASTVVFLDRDWSPANNIQAEDRLHRIGQKDAVEVIDIMARDTVDLGRRQDIEMKYEWLKQFLGST